MPISVTEGTTITIKGRVSDDPYRFGLSLLTTDDDSSIALYLSIQFDTNVVVINSKENCIWGDEERAAVFPFTRGKELLLTIVLTADCYRIKGNGEFLHCFRHRLPSSSVKRLVLSDEPNACSPSALIVDVQVTIK